MRSPFDRFASSVTQHLNRHGTRSLRDMKKKEVFGAIDAIVEFLETRSAPQTYLPYQYIHFQRQVDFIYDEGVRCVDKVYPITKIDLMLHDIAEMAGLDLPKYLGDMNVRKKSEDASKETEQKKNKV